jgi:hypothetical protein
LQRDARIRIDTDDKRRVVIHGMSLKVDEESPKEPKENENQEVLHGVHGVTPGLGTYSSRGYEENIKNPLLPTVPHVKNDQCFPLTETEKRDTVTVIHHTQRLKGLSGVNALLNELTLRLGITEENASNRLDYMVKEGYCKKANHLITITAKGNTLISKAPGASYGCSFPSEVRE